MTALAYDLRPDPLDSAAVRGLVHLPPAAQRDLTTRLVGALDRGDAHEVALLLRLFRECRDGIPRAQGSLVTQTYEEFCAEYGIDS